MGFRYCATDEFGYTGVHDVVTVHDFLATVLHLLGVVLVRLSFSQIGLDRRLTAVHGEGVSGVLA